MQLIEEICMFAFRFGGAQAVPSKSSLLLKRLRGYVPGSICHSVPGLRVLLSIDLVFNTQRKNITKTIER